MSLTPSALPAGSPSTVTALRYVLGVSALEAALGTPYPDQAAGEAATTAGQFFAVDNGDGTVTIRLRTGGGSTVDRTIAIGIGGGGGGGGGGLDFMTVASMLAHPTPITPVGTLVIGGGYRYEVVSSGEHLTTAGGTKLKALPDNEYYYIGAFGADLTGVSPANTVITTAAAAALADGKTLKHSSGILRVTSNLTIAAPFEVCPGATINNDGNYVTTINGLFTAQRANVFTGTVNATYGPTFAAGSIDEIYPEWFGAVISGASGPVVDCSAAFLRAFNAAARSFLGYAFTVSLGQGIYGWGTAVDVPAGGNFLLRGIAGSSQIRGMNTGGGYPAYIIRFMSSTADNRVSGIYFYSGDNTTRPVMYAIDSVEMKHTHVTDCTFAGFSVAAIASAEWDNKFENNEFSFCHVGIWMHRVGGNNNDITIDTCRFVSCEVAVVNNGGANLRIANCQFQAALVAPFTKTHVYSQGTAGFTFFNNYCESQSGGGMAGILFTVPETVLVVADIIFNGSLYFTDHVGTVGSTLSQTSPAGGTVGSIQDSLFNSPAYYNAGAGGTGYTAAAVTTTTLTGTGTGAAGTASVNAQTAVTNVTFGTPGSGYQVGDRIRIVQGASTGATAHVLTTTTNGGIASVVIGGNAAVYPGHVKSMTMENCNVNGALISLYNDIAYCNPYIFTVRNCAISGDLNVLLLGSNTTTIKSKLGNILIEGEAYRNNPTYASGPRSYFDGEWKFLAPPVASSFLRNGSAHQGMPVYRLTLLAANTNSDVLTGTIAVASSGGGNAELVGRRLYMSVLKSESAANVKLRLTLTVTVGTGVFTTQNYDSSTVFTKASAAGREEVSISLPRGTHSVAWTIEVIASTAASQFVDMIGQPVITIVSVPTERFDRDYLVKPLQTSVVYDPPLIAAGGSALQTVPFLGVRNGVEQVDVIAPYTLGGLIATAYTSANNEATILLFNPTAAGINLGSGTWRLRSTHADIK